MTKLYESDEETVRLFLIDALESGTILAIPTGRAKTSELRVLFTEWCAKTTRIPMSARQFGMIMERLGFPALRTMHSRLRGGLFIL